MVADDFNNTSGKFMAMERLITRPLPVPNAPYPDSFYQLEAVRDEYNAWYFRVHHRADTESTGFKSVQALVDKAFDKHYPSGATTHKAPPLDAVFLILQDVENSLFRWGDRDKETVPPPNHHVSFASGNFPKEYREGLETMAALRDEKFGDLLAFFVEIPHGKKSPSPFPKRG